MIKEFKIWVFNIWEQIGCFATALIVFVGIYFCFAATGWAIKLIYRIFY